MQQPRGAPTVCKDLTRACNGPFVFGGLICLERDCPQNEFPVCAVRRRPEPDERGGLESKPSRSARIVDNLQNEAGLDDVESRRSS
jgi:hypothetical protein